MVDLDVLREWLKLEPGQNDDDALLELLEARVVAFIERQTGYSYGAAGEVVEVVTGDGTGALYLANVPTADPTEVLEMAEVGDAGTEITAAASDGWVRRGSKLVRKAGGVWTAGAEFQVTYPSGYAAGAGPGEVQQAVCELVELVYLQRGKSGMQSEAISGYSYTRADLEKCSLIAQSVLNNVRPVLA